MLFANIDTKRIDAKMDMGVSFNISLELDHSVLERDEDDLDESQELLIATSKTYGANVVSPTESMEREFYNMLGNRKQQESQTLGSNTDQSAERQDLLIEDLRPEHYKMNYKHNNRFTERVGLHQYQVQDSIDLTILDDLGANKRVTQPFQLPHQTKLTQPMPPANKFLMQKDEITEERPGWNTTYNLTSEPSFVFRKSPYSD